MLLELKIPDSFKYQTFKKKKNSSLSCDFVSNVKYHDHKGLINLRHCQSESVQRNMGCVCSVSVDLKSTDEGTKREYYAFYEDYPQCDASLRASVFPCCIHI